MRLKEIKHVKKLIITLEIEMRRAWLMKEPSEIGFQGAVAALSVEPDRLGHLGARVGDAVSLLAPCGGFRYHRPP